MKTRNHGPPALSVRRPPAMKLLLLACALMVASCSGDQGAGATYETGTRGTPEEPSGVTGADESVGTLETRRPPEETGVVVVEADEREDQVLHRGSRRIDAATRLLHPPSRGLDPRGLLAVRIHSIRVRLHDLIR